MAEGDDLIGRYCDALSRQLRGSWPQRARVLEEVRAHLEDASVDGGAAAAVGRFGAVEVLAQRFAEERLRATLSANLPWMVGLGAVLLACTGLEAWFPVSGPFFDPGLRPSLAGWLEGLGLALSVALVPLVGAAAWLLWKGRVFAASQVWCAAFVALTMGPMSVAFGRWLASLATTGAVAQQPLVARLALVLVAFSCSLPLIASHDAFAATRRPVG